MLGVKVTLNPFTLRSPFSPAVTAFAQSRSFAAVNASSYGVQQFWATNFDTLPSSIIVLFEQMAVNNWFESVRGQGFRVRIQV